MQKTLLTPTETRLIPLSHWDQHHPWPTPAALRFYVFNQETNGFRKFGVVKRIGRRILIDEAAFFRWVDGQPGNTRGGASLN